MDELFGVSHYTEVDLKNEGFKSLGRNVLIAKTCTIIGAENISIGDNVRIDGYCTIVAAGNGYIKLGSYIHVGGYCVLLAAEGIIMQDFSGLSWGVQIFTKSDDFSGKHMTNATVPEKYKEVKGGMVSLGRHATVGANTVILPNVEIGDGAAVGAQALIKQNLDEWFIYAGTPAKKIKPRLKNLLLLEKRMLSELEA